MAYGTLKLENLRSAADFHWYKAWFVHVLLQCDEGIISLSLPTLHCWLSLCDGKDSYSSAWHNVTCSDSSGMRAYFQLFQRRLSPNLNRWTWIKCRS